MLFEQFQNIILEYKQDITAKKMGPALLQRFLRDPEENLQHLRPATQKAVDTYQKLNKDISDIGFEQADGSVDPETGKSGITSPEKQAKMEEKLAVLGDKLTLHLLNLIEEADPTKKNNYVQWLIRTYINDPSQPLEDVLSTVSDYLGKFHKLKIKNHLTNADIGQYKSFETFFDDLDNYSSDLIDDKEDSKQIWNADPIYDEDGILILSPKDEEAACHYGRGTRWCTSATRSNNYFQSYNRRGPLYIIAPRKPTYPGEKYQFHFQGGEFKDEKDDQLRGVDLIRLTTKYPGIKNAFVKQAEKDGLLWLQKPKQVVQGENFELEEYRKDNKPLYLLKPTDPESVGEIYTIVKDRGDQGEEYSVNIPGQADDMNLIDEHKFYKRFPDVARKFGLVSPNINLEPTLNTTDKLEVETHNKNLIMTDPVTGLKSAIVKNISSRRNSYDSTDYPENLKDSVKLISTSPFKLSNNDSLTRGNTDSRALMLNPYEYTKDHPELIDLYTPTIKNLLADSHKAINNNKSLTSAEKKEKKRQSYIDIAPYLPYKVYDKPDVYVKSHVNYKGQPIVDYVISKNDPDNYVIVDRDPDTGEVLQIKQVESRSPSEVRYGDEATGDIYNKQDQVIGNIKTDPDLKRLYDSHGDDHRQKALGFLPTLSFLEQYPGLKELYTDTKLSKPKLVKGSNANISDYGKIELGADSRDRYADVNAESMRNYVVKPNETVDGESFAISWSPELPQYAEVYYSDKNGKQVKLENTTQIRHIIQAFPELNKLHEKDYQALLDKDYSPGSFSQHGNRRYRNSELIPDYAFNPTEVIDNARVEVKQFGPQENATHSLPMFEVFPKEKNPFGEIGARFAVRFTLKDQRGKFGKISNIHINKLGKTPLEVVPVDQQGNTSIANGLVGRDDNEFIPVSTKSQSTDKDLNPKEVNDFFKYYPELRRLIKDENIHPKIPHPALATKPPEEEDEAVSTGVAYSNFTLDEVPSSDKQIKKYYIEPNETEYEGEFYTMYVVDPVLNTPAETGNRRVRTRDDENGSGSIFISQGEERGRYYSGYGDVESTKTQLDNLLRGGSTLIPSGTPEFNAMLSRFPDLKQIIAELAQEVGAPSYQQIDEDQIKEIGQDRVYAFNNKDGSKYYVITPIANPRRGEMGEIESYFPPDDYGNEVYPNSDANKWNDNSYAVDFKSTEQHPNMQVSLLVEPFKEKTVKQLANYFKNRKADKEKDGLSDEDIKMLRNGEEPEHMDVFNKFKGATTVQTRHETTNRNKLEYLQDIKTNPELYSYFQDLAEKRNAETSGIGQFSNFLPLSSDQLSDTQTDVPKLHGIDIVGIAKIGISNPLYIWQGREEIFNKLEYYASDREEKSKYNMRNQEYKDAMNDATGENVYSLGDLTFAFKPESGGKFLDLGAGSRSYINAGTFTQVPNATFLKVAPYALNLNNIIKPKQQKELGLIPSKTWTPRTIAAMPEKPKYNNNGKPWIKSIEEFKMPEGLGHNLAYYGDKQANKFLAPGTAYLVTLNPITDQPGPRKRKDGKLVRQMSPHNMLMRMTRDLDLPWEFRHNVLGAGNRDKEFIIYFANNRVAYILQSGGSFEKYNFTQEQKKNLFFDEEYGIFPEIKSLFDQYAKSNKWLRENRLIHDVLLESLGDKTHWELQKKMNKPNYGKLIWLKNQHLSGSYDNNKLKELGFFMKNGEWVIQQFKFDQLVKDNKLKEMINRPLVTGKNKIPNVGRKKVHENVWAFDAEKALELLKEPLLRGGGDNDPDLGCDMCGGHGCGSGYDIKDDLARWTEMLNPDADNRPEHLTNDYIQQKIEKLKAMVKKYPNGIPDNIDCSGGMSQQKHREWESNKGHDAADVLYDVIGDDGFHDDLYGMGPDEDVRPLIMNWLNPSWRAEQRKGLPEYPAVEDVDFAELYKRARQIYNPLTLVKEGKKFPRTSEFLQVKELEDIKRLAGVYEPYVEEGDGSMGSNISKTANKISNIMKEKNIQPGTPEWFQLWFSKPYLTGEKPYGE